MSEHPLPRSLTVEEIMNLLPHRYPFLLIDRLQDVFPGESAVGIKNVTVNENFFQGHFPGRPVMPGVLMIEALAQTAAALVMHTLGITAHDHLVYFMSIENARFRKPVVPGDTLHLITTKQHQRGHVWKFSGQALVDGAVVAEAVYTAMIVSRS